MRSFVLALVTSLVALAGCNPRTQDLPPKDALPADPAPRGTVDAPEPPATERVVPGDPKTLEGYWDSPGCGARGYRRTLHVEGTRFEADDIPHPCPGECVVQWVVKRKGTIVANGAELTLAVDATDDPEHQIRDTTFPKSLVIARGALAERAPNGDLCPYRR